MDKEHIRQFSIINSKLRVVESELKNVLEMQSCLGIKKYHLKESLDRLIKKEISKEIQNILKKKKKMISFPYVRGMQMVIKIPMDIQKLLNEVESDISFYLDNKKYFQEFYKICSIFIRVCDTKQHIVVSMNSKTEIKFQELLNIMRKYNVRKTKDGRYVNKA